MGRRRGWSGSRSSTEPVGGRTAPGLAGGWTDTARKRRSRRLLLTTNTEENAIAAPAISGLSSPAMASGSAATL